MLSRITEIQGEVESFSIVSREDLEKFRLKYLSRKGVISGLFDELKTLDKAEIPEAGKWLNRLKQLAQSKYDQGKQLIEAAERAEREEIDLTLPGRTFSVGREHILIQTLNEFIDIFQKIGFRIAEGPVVEEEYYNFDALNTPDWHPSRDIQDTFYVENKYDKTGTYLLRTHTSPVQVRTMLKYKPPIRIIAPGKCFRNETVTSKNYFMFHQVEGLYVSDNVSMRNLKGVLSYFVKTYYGENARSRFRPSYFPFTEPSAELDMTCIICGGSGCKTCKNSGWIELGGCGMVHPKVFQAVGYDPKKYSGYAFGMGVERIAMMKYGISDIRLFYQNDVRFLDQF